MKFVFKIICLALFVSAFLWAYLLLNIILNSSSDDREKVDAIVVLGASQWNGRPSPVLKARLDHANKLFGEGLSSNIALTGGIAEGDTISESRVGMNYLINKGVPDKSILIEEKGQILRNCFLLATVTIYTA